MKRITPRTCMWPLVGSVSIAFLLSLGLTFRSNHHCYAGTCGEWLFPLQARLHVIVWYVWLGLSILFLALRAFQPALRSGLRQRPGFKIPLFHNKLGLGGILLIGWIGLLYGALIGIWWVPLDSYFTTRGRTAADVLPGNTFLALSTLFGHTADVTMGMVLLPVSRHSALASFFKLAPESLYSLHMTQAYLLLILVSVHASLYLAWVAKFNSDRALYRMIYPILNPTYLYNEVWPGNRDSLGIWRASLIFTGTISTVIMFAMFLTSLPAIRKRYFNLFYFTHLGGLLAVVIICLHASTMLYCTLPGLSMWVLDWTMRILELRDRLPARVEDLGSGWFTVTVPIPRKRLSGCACHSPLAHFFIHHSKSSMREIHPFTTITHLASKKAITIGSDSIEIKFLFRESTNTSRIGSFGQNDCEKGRQWTNKLGSVTYQEKSKQDPSRGQMDVISGFNMNNDQQGTQTFLRLEGPYFTAATPERYRTVVCLVAGTGLSGALAIAAAFRAQNDDGLSCDPTNVHSNCSAAMSVQGQWQRLAIYWSVKAEEYVEMPFFSEMSDDSIAMVIHKTGHGRPRLNIKEALSRHCGTVGNNSWVYVSGPNGFITAAESVCSEFTGLTVFTSRWD